MPRHLISDTHEWTNDSHCPYLPSSEPTAKGNGLGRISGGKKTLVELDSSPTL